MALIDNPPVTGNIIGYCAMCNQPITVAFPGASAMTKHCKLRDKEPQHEGIMWMYQDEQRK